MKRKLCLIWAAALLAIPSIFSAPPLTLTEPSNLTAKEGFSVMSAGTKAMNAQAPARLAPRFNSGDTTGEIVIIDEDFSQFTAGSQEEPNDEYLGIPGEPFINPEYTHLPGWSTNYATQAGGTCALNTPIGGFINTPEGDYSGKLTISLRVKRINPNPTTVTLGVILASNGIWQPNILSRDQVSIMEDEVNGEGELDEDGWKNFTVTFDNTYTGNDGFIQFVAYYCQVLIDDIKVVIEDDGSVAAPTVLPASDFNLTGFTAHWSDVRLADSYLLSLYHEETVSDPIEETYDFNDGSTSTEPWAADGVSIKTADMGYEGSPAFVVENNSYITSPVYQGRLGSVKIWMRNIGDKPYYSCIKLQGYNGKEWVDFGELYLDMVPFDEEGATLLINNETRPSFYNTVNQVRFAFQGWDTDMEEGLYPRLIFDHIEIETLSGVERIYDLVEIPVSDNFMTLTDLDSYTDYYYEVASVRNHVKDWSLPMLAFGISTPEVLPASEVASDTYTANWIPTPKASLYRVRDLGVYTANKYEKEHEVIYEPFGIVEGGTREEPLFLDNNFSPCSLDEFTTYPGWVGASTIIADGMVGAGGSGYAYIQTPELTLSNSNGDFCVEITVDLLGDDGILITPSSATADYIGFEATEGENTIELYYHNGSPNETLRITSQYNTPFYIKSLTIYQDLDAGESVYTYLAGKVIEGNRESFRFENVDFDQYPSHAFDVMAIYNKDLKQCVSERSRYEIVDSPVKVNTIEGEATDFITSTGKGFIDVTCASDDMITIMHIDGKVVASEKSVDGKSIRFDLVPGIYIVKVGHNSRKMIVR